MCGLAGIISTKKTTFNINHFNILGALNDERGGDSCGIFIDGQVVYGIAQNAYFRNFTSSIQYPKSASIALLHCRKASPGYPIGIDQAQPVVIKEDDVIKFVLMHNGTILNIPDLLYKYPIDTSDIKLTDSQSLAYIIYKYGYDVLEEYKGAAVLIMVDYRGDIPKILMFKGSSCYNEPNTKEERPLKYMINDGKFYFSSMISSLYCINYEKIIYDFPINQLCEIVDNELILIKNFNNRLKLAKFYVQKAISFPYYNKQNLINYDKYSGFYKHKGKKISGKYAVFSTGDIIQQNSIYKNDTILWFYRGRLLYNEECYLFIKDFEKVLKNKLEAKYSEIIDFFAYGPRRMSSNNGLIEVDEYFRYIPYINGCYITLFNSSEQVTVTQGIETTKGLYQYDALAEVKKSLVNVQFDFNTLEDYIINNIIEADDLQ